jgi:hypothetical protein
MTLGGRWPTVDGRWVTVGASPILGVSDVSAVGGDPLVVAAGPVSAWSVAVVVGWLGVVILVWLLFYAYGRNNRGTSRP